MEKKYEEVLKRRTDEEIWILCSKIAEEEMVQDIVSEAGLNDFTQNCCSFVNKISQIPILGNVAVNINLFCGMLVDSFRKEYSISARTKCTIMLALAYLVMPVDMIPDMVPLVGMLDDASVLRIAGMKLYDELCMYKEFLEGKNRVDFIHSVYTAVPERCPDIWREDHNGKVIYIRKEAV